MPLNIPSSPDPFPLGPHALPLGLLNRACIQAGPTSWLKRRVAQHTLTHASLINDSTAALTNFRIPAALCIGPTCEAGLSTDTWKGACVTADSDQWVTRFSHLETIPACDGHHSSHPAIFRQQVRSYAYLRHEVIKLAKPRSPGKMAIKMERVLPPIVTTWISPSIMQCSTSTAINELFHM